MKPGNIKILGAFFFIIAIICSNGFLHPDEHFQILEFVNYKFGATPKENLTWEFNAEMRPAFQVFIAYSMGYFLKLIHIYNPFFLTFLLRMLSGVTMFIVLVNFAKCIQNELKLESSKKWFVGLLLLTWFVPFLAVRYSSENFSTLFMLAALASTYKSLQNKGFFSFLVVGLLLGLAFISRYQIGFMIIGLVGWLLAVKRIELKFILAMAVGSLIIISAGITMDRWLYGNWTLTAYHYFYENIVTSKAAEFGTSPIWYYALQTPTIVFPLFGLVIAPSLIYFFIKNRSHVLTWILIPFLLIHHIIGHKELRFLIPMFPFIIFIIIQVLEQLKWIRRNKWLIYPFLVLNVLALLIRTLLPADDQNALYAAINKHYSEHSIIYAAEDKYSLLMNDKPNNTYRDLNQTFYYTKPIQKTGYTNITQLDSLITNNHSSVIIARKGKYENELKPYFESKGQSTEILFETYHKYLEPINFNHFLYSDNIGWWLMIRIN